MSRQKTAEMELFRSTIGYTLLGMKRNEEMLQQVGVELIENKFHNYNTNQLNNGKRQNSKLNDVLKMKSEDQEHIFEDFQKGPKEVYKQT